VEEIKLGIKRFEEIEAWKRARVLVNRIFALCKNHNLKYEYAMQDQIKRASISIMLNIAEGFDAGSDKAFINFLSYSFRSASEVQSILYVFFDQGFIVQNEFLELQQELVEIKNLIAGFQRYLNKKSEVRSPKF
jgi:four helix bundle protein